MSVVEDAGSSIEVDTDDSKLKTISSIHDLNWLFENRELLASHGIKIDSRSLKPGMTLNSQTSSATQSLKPKVHHSVSKSAENDGVFVEILEQPQQRGLRFRYECESRFGGSIHGEKSVPTKKTFPTIKIHNYLGTAVIVVSCVTKEKPYKPHPHNLVGKNCRRGVCTIKVTDSNVISFPHLSIQCAKKKDVEDNLRQRQDINVDPFLSGFQHISTASSIDRNIVRLCFQVFIPDESGRITRIIPPVVSHPIYDKKSLNELVICRVSKPSGSPKGGEEVFLLCEKINREDIDIKFYKLAKDGNVEWEAFGEFSSYDIHRQYAIVFKTPPYKDKNITSPVAVQMQLMCKNSTDTSDPVQYIYMPDEPDPSSIIRMKKRKVEHLRQFELFTDGGSKADEVAKQIQLSFNLKDDAISFLPYGQQINVRHVANEQSPGGNSQGRLGGAEKFNSDGNTRFSAQDKMCISEVKEEPCLPVLNTMRLSDKLESKKEMPVRRSPRRGKRRSRSRSPDLIRSRSRDGEKFDKSETGMSRQAASRQPVNTKHKLDHLITSTKTRSIVTGTELPTFLDAVRLPSTSTESSEPMMTDQSAKKDELLSQKDGSNKFPVVRCDGIKKVSIERNKGKKKISAKGKKGNKQEPKEKNGVKKQLPDKGNIDHQQLPGDTKSEKDQLSNKGNSKKDEANSERDQSPEKGNSEKDQLHEGNSEKDQLLDKGFSENEPLSDKGNSEKDQLIDEGKSKKYQLPDERNSKKDQLLGERNGEKYQIQDERNSEKDHLPVEGNGEKYQIQDERNSEKDQLPGEGNGEKYEQVDEKSENEHLPDKGKIESDQLQDKEKDENESKQLQDKGSSENEGEQLQGKGSSENESEQLQGKGRSENESEQLQGKGSSENENEQLQGKGSSENESEQLQGKGSSENESEQLQGKGSSENESEQLQGKGSSENESEQLQGKGSCENESEQLQGKGSCENESEQLQGKGSNENESEQVQYKGSCENEESDKHNDLSEGGHIENDQLQNISNEEDEQLPVIVCYGNEQITIGVNDQVKQLSKQGNCNQNMSDDDSSMQSSEERNNTKHNDMTGEELTLLLRQNFSVVLDEINPIKLVSYMGIDHPDINRCPAMIKQSGLRKQHALRFLLELLVNHKDWIYSFWNAMGSEYEYCYETIISKKIPPLLHLPEHKMCNRCSGIAFSEFLNRCNFVPEELLIQLLQNEVLQPDEILQLNKCSNEQEKIQMFRKVISIDNIPWIKFIESICPLPEREASKLKRIINEIKFSPCSKCEGAYSMMKFLCKVENGDVTQGSKIFNLKLEDFSTKGASNRIAIVTMNIDKGKEKIVETILRKRQIINSSISEYGAITNAWCGSVVIVMKLANQNGKIIKMEECILKIVTRIFEDEDIKEHLGENEIDMEVSVSEDEESSIQDLIIQKISIISNFTLLLEELDVNNFMTSFSDHGIMDKEEFKTKFNMRKLFRKQRTRLFLEYVLHSQRQVVQAFFEVLRNDDCYECLTNSMKNYIHKAQESFSELSKEVADQDVEMEIDDVPDQEVAIENDDISSYHGDDKAVNVDKDYISNNHFISESVSGCENCNRNDKEHLEMKKESEKLKPSSNEHDEAKEQVIANAVNGKPSEKKSQDKKPLKHSSNKKFTKKSKYIKIRKESAKQMLKGKVDLLKLTRKKVSSHKVSNNSSTENGKQNKNQIQDNLKLSLENEKPNILSKTDSYERQVTGEFVPDLDIKEELPLDIESRHCHDSSAMEDEMDRHKNDAGTHANANKSQKLSSSDVIKTCGNRNDVSDPVNFLFEHDSKLAPNGCCVSVHKLEIQNVNKTNVYNFSYKQINEIQSKFAQIGSNNDIITSPSDQDR